ncbi:YjbH domain-containing protein [Histidinibacterium aquaticum]|uniref:YjbH domain-containing protein n=1 Tax=Histidinibacterium aquaticum TaxID=2613962 RepID=A0A5J5GDT4_9RHOB|nr:YjbH domain-containing protein [Histidinibacterium aquaticum]KAA9005983.1 YjbH domain-containing protein [Histidinibacterium aquaticum]
MRLKTTTILAGAATLAAAGLQAQSDWRPSYTLYGDPGLIEMPSGASDPDGQFSLTFGGFDLQQRGTLSFQITDRLGGSFRYSRLDEFSGPESGATYDRSFDVRFRFLDEGRYTPAMTVGLRDFLGTGRYSGEYIAATKTFGPDLRVTAGLGWGRLGTEGGFDNPLGVIDDRFEDRPRQDDAFFEEGGTVSTEAFFRGDAAVFGGIEYRLTEELTGVVEYSSDAYARESQAGTYDPESPLNFGLTYQPRENYILQAAYLNGNTLGLSATFTVNPNDRPTYGRRDPAPVPVAVRAAEVRAAQTWDRGRLPEATLRQLIVDTLDTEGQSVSAVELTDRQVRIRYTNTKYRTEAQAMGRITRILTQALPPSIELITLEPVRAGIPTSSATFRRSDIEELENTVGASQRLFERTQFSDAANTDAGLVDVQNDRPRFDYGIGPYITPRYFDPDQPISASIGLQFSADYYIQPNLVVSGLVRQEVVGPEDEASSGSALPPVRTNADLYGRDRNPTINRLQVAHYGRPAENLYSRVTVGYLERMFGGLSSELLWKPVDSRLALGAEVNYARQRDFDVLFDFQDYDVWTGHASAYYDLGNGFHAQLDAGRYLAGDWGATISLDREFANGWKVGAFVTRTDVSYEDFGEGSFDKGLRITIPTDWTIGTATRQEYSSTLRSLQRDGGARLSVDGRLYDVIRDSHPSEMQETWGRFWR